MIRNGTEYIKLQLENLRKQISNPEETESRIHAAKNPEKLKSFIRNRYDSEDCVGYIEGISWKVHDYLEPFIQAGGICGADAEKIRRYVENTVGMYCTGIEAIPDRQEPTFGETGAGFAFKVPKSWTRGDTENLKTCGRGV